MRRAVFPRFDPLIFLLTVRRNLMWRLQRHLKVEVLSSFTHVEWTIVSPCYRICLFHSIVQNTCWGRNVFIDTPCDVVALVVTTVNISWGLLNGIFIVTLVLVFPLLDPRKFEKMPLNFILIYECVKLFLTDREDIENIDMVAETVCIGTKFIKQIFILTRRFQPVF